MSAAASATAQSHTQPQVPQRLPVPGADAPLRVVKGTLLAVLAGSLAGSAYGVTKGRSGSLFALRMGTNSFIFSFPFFALREYAISPLLAFSSRAPSSPAGPQQSSVAGPSLHTRNIAASAISGGIVGGAIATWARGPRSALPGIVTFATLCAALQLAGNEVRIARVRVLSAYAPSTPGTTVLPSPLDAPQSVPVTAPSPPPKRTEVDRSSASGLTEAPQTTNMSAWSRIKTSFAALAPVRPVSDREYAEKLQVRLADVDTRLEEVRTQLTELEREEEVGWTR